MCNYLHVSSNVCLLRGCWWCNFGIGVLDPWIALLRVCQHLCAGYELGKGRVAPVYAKVICPPLFRRIRNIGFCILYVQAACDLLGAVQVPRISLGVAGVLLGAF